MKKSISIGLIIILIAGIILAGIPSKTYAYSASMSASSRTVTEGDTVTVTVNFGRGVSSAQFTFTYGSQLELTGRSTGTYNAGTKQFGFFGANDSISSVTFTFKANATGTANVSASGVLLSYGDDTYDESAGSASTSIKINPKPTPTPEPTSTPTPKPQQPEPTQKPNTPEEPKVTDTPERPEEPTPTPTPEPDNNENNEVEENNTDNENQNNNDEEKASDRIIKIDESDVITIKDEENDVMVKGESIAIKESDVTLSVKQIEEDSSDRFKSLSDIVKNIKGNKKYFDIKLLKDGLAIEPNGYVTVYLPIPEGYNKDKVEVYSINEQTKKYEKKNGEIQDKYYTFTTNNFEEAYTLVEKEENTKSNKIKNIIFMVLGAIVIMVIIIIFMRKIN